MKKFFIAYLGLAVFVFFFVRRSLKKCSRSDFFRGLFFDFFKFISISFTKRKANYALRLGD